MQPTPPQAWHLPRRLATAGAAVNASFKNGTKCSTASRIILPLGVMSFGVRHRLHMKSHPSFITLRPTDSTAGVESRRSGSIESPVAPSRVGTDCVTLTMPLAVLRRMHLLEMSLMSPALRPSVKPASARERRSWPQPVSTTHALGPYFEYKAGTAGSAG